MPIEKVKDPLLLELERIAKNELAIPCTFLHADLFEANFGLDHIAADTEIAFPVLLHVANGKNQNTPTQSSNMIRKAKVYCLLLQRYDDKPTSGYSSEKANDLIYAMHQLADNLIFWINKSPLSVGSDNAGKSCGTDQVDMVDVYGKFDADLFGVGLEFTWTVDKGSNGYLNRAY